MAQTLQPISFPLRGSRLIEASAGTGKTYTIAALYLRLVLQHGHDNTGFSRALLPPEILVMTYTKAATQELKERIRDRLADAAAVFRGQKTTHDAFLNALLADYSPELRPAKAFVLDTAAQWMDQAVVSTIHGWCQRMLKEHAFASRSVFDQEVNNDNQGLMTQAVRDYWRVHCYRLDESATGWVAAYWETPEKLWKKVSSAVLAQVAVSAPADFDLAAILAPQAQILRKLAQLKAAWHGQIDALQAAVAEAKDKGYLSGSKITNKINSRFDALRQWVNAPMQIDLGLDATHAWRFTPEGMADAAKKGKPILTHPGLDLMAKTIQQLAALQDQHKQLEAQARAHAVWHIRQLFEQTKTDQAQIDYDDMLTNLRRALDSEHGEGLAQLIRNQFPVALVDEFQDTDPIQYAILDRIYRIKDNDPTTGLFLIGDPKQAIYSFRGADFETYLQARQATKGRHYTLATNFRSAKTMVDAVNLVFEKAEANQPSGAFCYNDHGDNPLPFMPVAAHGKNEVWQVNGQSQPALTFWHWPSEKGKGHSKTAYQQTLAAQCANTIADILNNPQAGFVSVDVLKRVAPRDMAILVNNANEARSLEQALAQRGIKSVYLSQRTSVFESQEAKDLAFWLNACLHPQDERAIKSCLASITMDRRLEEIEALQADELVWEEIVVQFKHYQTVWHYQGILPMLRQLMHDYELPQRLVKKDNGERVLTNLLHLSELLEHAARELDGQLALLQYLQQACAQAGEANQAHELRLESDEDLVRIVTIHKSKGLEYPLVFLPYASLYRATQPADSAILRPPGYAERQYFATLEDEALFALAQQQQLNEDVRKLYVALTRASHACWVGVAAINKYTQGAINHVLGASDDAALTNQLSTLTTAHYIRAIAIAADAPQIHYRMTQTAFTPSYRQFAGLQSARWWVASFSALAAKAQGVEIVAPLTGADETLADDEPDIPIESQAFSADEPVEPAGIHAFARGSRPGSFLHHLLERVIAPEVLQAQSPQQARYAVVEQLCQQYGFEADQDMLADWLERLTAQRFLLANGSQFCLSRLPAWHNEMEFLLSVQATQAAQVDAWVRKHVQLDAAANKPRPYLASEQVNGLFKGFIDLLFEQDGRYYVLDYKSNHLGDQASAYSREAMQACAYAHRYELQYTLYTLALHRLLKVRLPNYDYDQHAGGAMLLFLRGIDGPEQGLQFYKPPRALIEQLDAQFANPQSQLSL